MQIVKIESTEIVDFVKLHPEIEDAGLDMIIVLFRLASIYSREYGKYVYASVKASNGENIGCVVFNPQKSFRQLFQKLLYKLLGIRSTKHLKNIKSLGDESQSLTVNIGKVEYTFTLQTVHSQQSKSNDNENESNANEK